MSLLARRTSPEPVTGAERAFEVRVAGLGGFELRPTRLFLWAGEERAGNERLVPLAERPVGLDHARRESTVKVGAVEVRSLGNPLLTVALAGVLAFKRWAEAPDDRERGETDPAARRGD